MILYFLMFKFYYINIIIYCSNGDSEACYPKHQSYKMGRSGDKGYEILGNDKGT